MSAYGAITRQTNPEGPLATTVWNTKRRSVEKGPKQHLVLHHLTLQAALKLPGLIAYLHEEFAEEVERGMTYPQEMLQGEVYTQDMFETYFFAADVIIAVIIEGVQEDHIDGAGYGKSIEEVRNGRSWEEAIAGVYYVKPNYPGRSSHICNAGFLVPKAQRAKGYGAVLARSFLHYAPRLGYEASVFNLVYANNVASIKLWESLNFQKAGLIPRAGRLKKADGSGEEYVDAWVVYKQFDQESGVMGA